jgi:hypothetical protein
MALVVSRAVEASQSLTEMAGIKLVVCLLPQPCTWRKSPLMRCSFYYYLATVSDSSSTDFLYQAGVL